jgi:hypothetical protein
MKYDNRRTQLSTVALNLVYLKRDLPTKANQKAEIYLDKLVNLVNDFINAPEESDVDLPWVTSLINFYSHVDNFEVSDAFFQRIELAKLAKFYQAESLSYLTAFLQPFVHYLRQYDQRGESTERLNKIISSIFREIDLGNYADSVNDNLQERWAMVSQPEYTSENNETLSSVISSVANYFYTVSNLLSKDDEIHIAIRSQVDDFYYRINFRLLGKLLEAQEKELGPIIRIINVVRKSDCDKVLIEQMLSEIDFRRLAKVYNDKPSPSCNQLASFCKAYLYTKSLHEEWNDFFETLDFSKCIMKGGFSFVDATFMLQILTHIFKKNYCMLSNALSDFDFEQVGLKARGKRNRSLNLLFRRLLSAHLTQGQYREFIAGFGVEECRRLTNDRNLLGILKRCNYSNGELEQLGIIAIF